MWVLTSLPPPGKPRPAGRDQDGLEKRQSSLSGAYAREGSPRQGGREGFTKSSWGHDAMMGIMWRKHVKNVRYDTWFEIKGKVY
jgi:hypothetical protein